MGLLIVDISWCQGLAIDWQRVKASGCVAVIIKVTEGLLGIDPNARRNIDAARAAGLIVAVYDFARPSQGHPEDQFDAMWKAMGDQVPGFCALDLESAPADMTPAQVVEFAERWETRAKEVSGRYQPFYSFDWFITHQMGSPLVKSTIMAQCPLWIAQPSWPKPSCTRRGRTTRSGSTVRTTRRAFRARSSPASRW
jgi:GH25 family lysozyme M1 (1,4-beta-N-acetylmuramidase)